MSWLECMIYYLTGYAAVVFVSFASLGGWVWTRVREELIWEWAYGAFFVMCFFVLLHDTDNNINRFRLCLWSSNMIQRN